MKLKIYLAGPITGQTYEQVEEYFLKTRDTLKEDGFHVLYPKIEQEVIRLNETFRSHGYDDNPISNDNAIFRRDHWMVHNCDIILINLLNGKEKTSIGTCFEMAWAYAYKKHIVTVLDINEKNIHKHAFPLQASDVIFKTVEEATTYLSGYLK